jgi:ribokinase
MKHICVLGSINMDIVLKVDRMVKVGETILSKGFNKSFGGKGANQAVAVSRLGVKVFMIGNVGIDDNGNTLLSGLKRDNIDVEFVNRDSRNETGMAIITVDDLANNSIIVIPGANMSIECSDIKKAESIIKMSKLIIAQFETPINTTIAAFKIARENSVLTILNPAPAREIPTELLSLTDIIVPNEVEVYELTKVKIESEDSIKHAARKFIERGVKYVIITLGERGAALVSNEGYELLDAVKVNAVDTTAAGDSFIGALACILSRHEKIEFELIKQAIIFANKVSSMVVQREGAQASIPTLEQVTKVFGEE